jgi:cytochrome c-type biogenesis protein CcmH
MRRIVLGCVLLLSTVSANAGLEEFDFSGNVDEDRYKALISELRCLVCQNQSLADSDADLARDLRVEVYEHMQQGSSDGEIVDFMVARYGDFVLYSPPVKPSTYLLWYGPFVLLLIGLLLLFRNVRRRAKHRSVSFTDEERERIKTLLNGDSTKGGES